MTTQPLARYGARNGALASGLTTSVTPRPGTRPVMLEALNETGAGNDSVQMIDSTIIRAHQHAAGALKKGMRTKVLAALVVASRPRSTSAATLSASLSRSR